jgi:hypothetical protein
MDLVRHTQQWHLPWSLVQWVLTTPLGNVILLLLSSLVWSLPFAVVVRVNLRIIRPVDVTDLPLEAWLHQRPAWGDPDGGTLTDQWFGRSQSQRARNRLALALSVLLLGCLTAAVVALIGYAANHYGLACEPAGCPPILFEPVLLPSLWLGMPIANLGQVIWIAGVERRCGVWFRARVGGGSLGAYIRRPDVTPETAAAALRPYARHTRPWAQFIVLSALILTLAGLLFIGGMLLSTWLATQWIPG